MISKVRQLTYRDIRPTLNELDQYISDFVVAFIKRQSEERGALAGSGTLVASGRNYAILTADHVLSGLPRSGEIGLALPWRIGPRETRFVLNMDHARRITVGKASLSSDGPDLGLLVLAPQDVGRLNASKNFYNLGMRRDRMLLSPQNVRHGAWVLSGVPDEWTISAAPPSVCPPRNLFRGATFAANAREGRQTTAFDYLEVDARYDCNYEGPKEFQGCSGGGLWQAVLAQDSDTIVIKDILLSGVAFYQSDLIDGHRTIYCHGRRSIYEQAVRALDEATVR